MPAMYRHLGTAGHEASLLSVAGAYKPSASLCQMTQLLLVNVVMLMGEYTVHAFEKKHLMCYDELLLLSARQKMCTH